MLQDGHSTKANRETIRISHPRGIWLPFPPHMFTLWTQMDKVKVTLTQQCKRCCVPRSWQLWSFPLLQWRRWYHYSHVPHFERRSSVLPPLRDSFTYDNIYEHVNISLKLKSKDLMLMHTKLIVREWLTICQAADTEQCDSQEEQHSDVSRKRQTCNQK